MDDPIEDTLNPLQPLSQGVQRLRNEIVVELERAQAVVQSMPAAMFVTHPNWAQAGWMATTYQWHPTSAAPPLIGLVFANEHAGIEIFRDAMSTLNHADPLDEIRISIIEGTGVGGEARPGYSIHLSPDPVAFLARATLSEVAIDSKLISLLGQWNRHFPIPGTPTLLDKFKEEYARHGEFMLAPVVQRSNGSSHMDHRLGIVKHRICFRKLCEIVDETDIDAFAHVLPLLSAAPEA